MLDLGPARAEKALGVVGVDLTRKAVCFLMVNPVQRVAGVKLIP